MASRNKCANCGRDVRQLPDAERRFEGGRWFCSQSCFLTYESASSRSRTVRTRKPRHKWRRRIGWSFAVVVVLFIGLGTAGYFVSSTTTVADPGRAPASGAVPLRRLGGAYDGWRLRILSANVNARQYVGPDRRTISAKGREVMVTLAATYTGSGYAHLQELSNRLNVSGSHDVFYRADSGDIGCAAKAAKHPSAASVKTLNKKNPDVFSGETVRGHLCFQIASNDVATLAFSADPPGCKNTATVEVCSLHTWFALAR